VVLSKAFLGKKKWTEHELNGLFAREQAGQKLILPIWHGITRDDLLQYSPALADRLAMISATESHDDIVKSLSAILGKARKEPPTRAATSGNVSSGKKGEMISAANYYGPDGNRVNLFVRKSLKNEDTCVLEDADGFEQEGPLQDIALKYVTADRKLTMNGYKRMGFHGNGQYPQFNL
jgi:hypothetical protein